MSPVDNQIDICNQIDKGPIFQEGPTFTAGILLALACRQDTHRHTVQLTTSPRGFYLYEKMDMLWVVCTFVQHIKYN